MQDHLLDLDTLHHWGSDDSSHFPRLSDAIEQRLAWWRQKHEQDRLDRYRSIASF